MKLDGIIEDLPSKNTPLCKSTFEKMCNAVINKIYPIGISIMFEDNEDHSKFLGLTWERNLVNQTPIGCNESGSNIGETKGEETHKHNGPLIAARTSSSGGDLLIGFSNSYEGSNHIENTQVETFYGVHADVNREQVYQGTAYSTDKQSSYQPSKVVAYWKRIA